MLGLANSQPAGHERRRRHKRTRSRLSSAIRRATPPRSPASARTHADPCPLSKRAPATAGRLRITEIFASLQGESTRVGLPTVFVRLTRRPLRCTWCDTVYAFSGGETRTLDDILAEVAIQSAPRLRDRRRTARAEGLPTAARRAVAMPADVSSGDQRGARHCGVDPRACRASWTSGPGSGELARNRWENLVLLRAHDELKFVLADAADYAWANGRSPGTASPNAAAVLLSPVAGALDLPSSPGGSCATACRCASSSSSTDPVERRPRPLSAAVPARRRREQIHRPPSR